ncbi:hypothetical protein SteCoe_27588 [Stentor coeruleus]|uniref:Uncharacterized protein n=1 Tax=Stentor coeruleus TaxID=5963 RepID=A0A1R2BA58_9CILI|nr:hypothetical protein SteCoe_27588 [Stentor coeruleus]
MDPNNPSVYSNTKLKKLRKDMGQSKKQNPLVLPHLRESNINSNATKHSEILDDIKISLDPNKKLRLHGLGPISPNSDGYFTPRSPILDWPKTLKSDKNMLSQQAKIKKGVFLYHKLENILENLDSLNLNPQEKDLIKIHFPILDLQEKLNKLTGKNEKYDTFPNNTEAKSIIFDEKYDFIKEHKTELGFYKNLDYVKETSDEQIIPVIIDDKDSIKNDIEGWKEKYMKLEDVYYNDTNDLKKIIEGLKMKNEVLKEGREKALEKIEIINAKYENCMKVMEEKDKMYKKEIAGIEGRLNDTLEDLCDKKYELTQTIECVNRNNKIKKEHEAMICELQDNIKRMNDVNCMYITEMTSLKSALENCQKDLKAEKKKSSTLESLTKDLSGAKSCILSLEESKKSLKAQLDFITINYKTLQESFLKYQERVSENEKTFKTTIENLKTSTSPQNHSFPLLTPQDLIKIRRNSTIVSNTHDLIPQNTIKNLMNKTALQEQQLIFYQQELEKSSKDQVHNRKLIEEKNLIITHMEKQILNNKFDLEDEIKKNVLKEIEIFLKKYKKMNKYSNGIFIGKGVFLED